MISDEKILKNMTADEKFTIICRILNINKDEMIKSIINEIKELYDYAQSTYMSEFTTDSEYNDGEEFGGYILYLKEIESETYKSVKLSHLEEYDDGRIGDFDAMDFDSEYLDLDEDKMNFVRLAIECGLTEIKYWCN